MQALLALSRVIDRLNALIGKYAIWLIFAATVISALNAIVRKAFNYSSNGFLEVQWYLFAWSFLIAAGYTLLNREHVRIDVLNAHFSKRADLDRDSGSDPLPYTRLRTGAVVVNPHRRRALRFGRDVTQPRWPDSLASVDGATRKLLPSVASGLV